MFKIFQKIKNKKYKNQKRGITLVIAITTMTLLLSISLSISNIVLRQIKITNISNSSKPAFFVADSALECAFYFDTSFVEDSANPGVDLNADFETAVFGRNMGADGNSANAFIKANVFCGNRGILHAAKDISNPDKVITTFDIGYGDACASVIVERTEVNTVITSRGYNTKPETGVGCDLSNANERRIVERGLTLKY